MMMYNPFLEMIYKSSESTEEILHTLILKNPDVLPKKLMEIHGIASLPKLGEITNDYNNAIFNDSLKLGILEIYITCIKLIGLENLDESIFQLINNLIIEDFSLSQTSILSYLGYDDMFKDSQFGDGYSALYRNQYFANKTIKIKDQYSNSKNLKQYDPSVIIASDIESILTLTSKTLNDVVALSNITPTDIFNATSNSEISYLTLEALDYFKRYRRNSNLEAVSCIGVQLKKNASPEDIFNKLKEIPYRSSKMLGEVLDYLKDNVSNFDERVSKAVFSANRSIIQIDSDLKCDNSSIFDFIDERVSNIKYSALSKCLTDDLDNKMDIVNIINYYKYSSNIYSLINQSIVVGDDLITSFCDTNDIISQIETPHFKFSDWIHAVRVTLANILLSEHEYWDGGYFYGGGEKTNIILSRLLPEELVEEINGMEELFVCITIFILSMQSFHVVNRVKKMSDSECESLLKELIGINHDNK